MAEAVGSVLGIAPRIISAFEDYDNTVRCMHAFKGYTLLTDVHHSTLSIQQTIFRKANERMLRFCGIECDLARRMLADRDHSSWMEGEIAAHYPSGLADVLGEFQESIGLICEELAKLRYFYAKLETFELEDLGAINERLRHALKDGNIERSLMSLTERTRDLVSLIGLTDSPQRQKARRIAAASVEERVQPRTDDLPLRTTHVVEPPAKSIVAHYTISRDLCGSQDSVATSMLSVLAERSYDRSTILSRLVR